MKKQKFLLIIALVAALAPGCDRDDDKDGDITVIKASGDISSSMNQFRQVLGSTLNTTPGAVGGHREINWDGVPDSLMGQQLPARFFNPVGNEPALVNRQRGLVYAPTPAPGGLMVSNTRFSTVNGEAASEFAAFSGDKTFANISNSLWQIDPEVPGQNLAATVKGFGIVFSDVDEDSSTFIEFFNENRSLGKFFVPKHDATSSFSFLGVHFKNEKVTSIKVGHEGFLASGEKDITQGGTKDLVVLDDFMYDEPVKK
jgi:hypothetical protein